MAARKRAKDPPIGILCALPQELTLLADALDGAAEVPGPGGRVRRGELDGRPVVLAAAGVGKVNAATTATSLMERASCHALVLSGVAGGLAETLEIGDLVVADRVIDIDYGRITDDGRVVYQPGVLPLSHVAPEPGYRLSPGLDERIRQKLAVSVIGAALGTVLSGDAFLASTRVRDELAQIWGGLAIEMEGAAICGVAERYEVPWLVVRSLSDRAGEDSGADFEAALERSAAASAALVRELLPVFDA